MPSEREGGWVARDPPLLPERREDCVEGLVARACEGAPEEGPLP